MTDQTQIIEEAKKLVKLCNEEMYGHGHGSLMTVQSYICKLSLLLNGEKGSLDPVQKISRIDFIPLAKKVYERRVALGLTEEQLAHRAGFTVKAIKEIKRCQLNITLLSLMSLAEALECEVSDLI